MKCYCGAESVTDICQICRDAIAEFTGKPFSSLTPVERFTALRARLYQLLPVSKAHRALAIIEAWDQDFAIHFLKDHGIDGRELKEKALFQNVAKIGGSL